MSLSSKLDAKCSSALCFWVSNPFQNTLSLVEYGDMNDLDCTELIFINNYVTVFFFMINDIFFERYKEEFFLPEFNHSLCLLCMWRIDGDDKYLLPKHDNARNVLFEKFQEKNVFILHLNNKQDFERPLEPVSRTICLPNDRGYPDFTSQFIFKFCFPLIWKYFLISFPFIFIFSVVCIHCLKKLYIYMKKNFINSSKKKGLVFFKI